jgi:hypothetical protein
MAEPIQPPQYHDEAAFAPFVADMVLQRTQDKLQELWPLMTGMQDDASIYSRTLACYLLTTALPCNENSMPRIVHESSLERFLVRDVRARARYVEFGSSVSGRSLCMQLVPIDQRDIADTFSYMPHDYDLITLRDGVGGPLVDCMPASLACAAERAVDAVAETRLQRADVLTNLVCQAFFVK